MKCVIALLVDILIIVGALNWGLVGAFDFNLVTALFGLTLVSKIVYIAVGVAAIVKIFYMIQSRKC